jgi:heme/copper-type cytochrome/quinol oxidase subunit 2
MKAIHITILYVSCLFILIGCSTASQSDRTLKSETTTPPNEVIQFEPPSPPSIVDDSPASIEAPSESTPEAAPADVSPEESTPSQNSDTAEDQQASSEPSSQQSEAPASSESLTSDTPDVEAEELKEEEPGESDPVIVQVEVTNWDWNMEQVTFEIGSTVIFKINVKEGNHGFQITGTDINERISVGQSYEITWTPASKGSFTIRCSVPCGAGHSSMRKNLTVI